MWRFKQIFKAVVLYYRIKQIYKTKNHRWRIKINLLTPFQTNKLYNKKLHNKKLQQIITYKTMNLIIVEISQKIIISKRNNPIYLSILHPKNQIIP
jgi:hypothetical protein